MFNLIPDFLKEKIITDYKRRRIVVWFFGFFWVLCALLIFLLPTYVYVFFEEKNMLADADSVKNSVQFRKADQVAQTIVDTNDQLKALTYSVNSVNPVASIQKIIETKNTDIHILEIEYTENHATTSRIVIKGVADRREGLRQFVTNLESMKDFSDVVLPVSNFAKDKDIDFTISITAL